MTVTPQNEPTIPIVADEETAENFESFASSLPESASGFLDAEPIASNGNKDEEGGAFLDGSSGAGMPSSGDYAPPDRKRVNVTKKVRRAMNKFKTRIADVPILWFHQQAKDNPEWELDKEEQELIKDSIETVFDVLDIEVEIQPLSWTLQSVWWVLSYPILAFVFLFLVKKSKTIERATGLDEGNV
ncbi:MAG TPA: hypothetical protein VGE97_00800 [Nitrososphaera sp.]|jgi:hypothetical protein